MGVTMRFSNFGFAALFLAVAAIISPASMASAPAEAATGAANATEIAVTPLKLTEYNPLKVRNKGPALAEGVIYFVDGLDSYNRTRDDYRATYPYVYGLNNHYGWDVIAAKFPNAEQYSFRSVPRSSKYLLTRLSELRAQGYKRVILAGQSWGAWVTVDVAKRDEARGIIEAIMLTAPATYGTADWGGKPNPYFILNKTEYLENIKTIRIPTIATFFQDDTFDPGGRGPATRDTFKQNRVAALIIDRPDSFIGHGAGWMPSFDYAFGACINAFLEEPKDMQCSSAPPRSNTDSRVVDTEQDVLAGGGTLVSLKDIDNKTFLVISPRGRVTVEQYGLSTAKVLSDTSLYMAQMVRKGDQICFSNACSRIYRLKDGALIGFGSDGNWTSKMIPAD
jgi:pimeloyl-ACP methyl ester carboxylesterase